MTVQKLIALLQTMPPRMKVKLVFDSAVCVEDIVSVRRWKREHYQGREFVGLFDDGSEDDFQRVTEIVKQARGMAE